MGARLCTNLPNYELLWKPPIACSLPHSAYTTLVFTREGYQPSPIPTARSQLCLQLRPFQGLETISLAEAGLLLGKPLDSGGPGASLPRAVHFMHLTEYISHFKDRERQGRGKREGGTRRREGRKSSVACPKAGQQTGLQSR